MRKYVPIFGEMLRFNCILCRMQMSSIGRDKRLVDIGILDVRSIFGWAIAPSRTRPRASARCRTPYACIGPPHVEWVPRWMRLDRSGMLVTHEANCLAGVGRRENGVVLHLMLHRLWVRRLPKTCRADRERTFGLRRGRSYCNPSVHHPVG